MQHPERAQSVGDVFRGFARDPYEYFIRRWNWKSALTSAIIRAAIFFSANLSAGLQAATGAMAVEFCFRAATSGFYGSIAEAFRKAHPAWKALLVPMVMLPVISHSIEFTVHYLRGTPKLARSITASIIFTAISTLFNLYAMRRGIMLVGEQRKSLASDMKQLPRIIGEFLAVGPMALWRLIRGGTRQS